MEKKDSIKIKEIFFKATDGGNDSRLLLNTSESQGSVTIFVGPNNSGKSTALREVLSLCRGEDLDSQLIEKILIEHPKEQIETLLLKLFEHTEGSDRKHYLKPSLEQGKIGQGKYILKFQIDKLNEDELLFKQNVLWLYSEILVGKTRFFLADDQKDDDQNKPSTNHFTAVLKDKNAYRNVRDAILDCFKIHCYIDHTRGQMLKLVVLDQKDSQQLNEFKPENSLDRPPKVAELFRKGKPVSEFGDGVKCFAGLLLGVYGLEDTIILIDEPEAFLAPPIAKKLGKELSKIAKERNASLVVATHSADFVMGCIETKQNSISIVRLTYENDIGKAKVIDENAVEELFETPPFRSVGAINGLFHNAVIVTEGHRDRVFYDEINRQIAENDVAKRFQIAIEDALFLDSGGGITLIPKLINSLRKVGVPAAAIVDLDFISPENESVWDVFSSYWSSDKSAVAELYKLKNCLFEALGGYKNQEKKILNPSFKRGGLNKLQEGEAHTEYTMFLKRIAEYGIFVVPYGELEAWPTLKPSWENVCKKELTKGKNWDTNIWNYIQEISQIDQLKNFMKMINSWVSNPNRLGMP